MRHLSPKPHMSEDHTNVFRPQARASGLVVRKLADEVLVYDLERHRSHCLNPTAALVWDMCDGQTTLGEMARRLGERLNAAVDEQLVGLALAQLERRRLLCGGRAPRARAVSRRALVRRAGIAAVLLPLVTSIAVPTALAAVSCSGACSDQNDCAPGCVCVGSTCVPA